MRLGHPCLARFMLTLDMGWLTKAGMEVQPVGDHLAALQGEIMGAGKLGSEARHSAA